MMSFDDGNPCAAVHRAKAVAAKRLAHVELPATQVRVRTRSAESPSRSSRLTSRDGQRFEERQDSGPWRHPCRVRLVARRVGAGAYTWTCRRNFRKNHARRRTTISEMADPSGKMGIYVHHVAAIPPAQAKPAKKRLTWIHRTCRGPGLNPRRIRLIARR